MSTARKPKIDSQYLLDIGQINFERAQGEQSVGAGGYLRKYADEDRATASQRSAQQRQRSGQQFDWTQGDIGTNTQRRGQDYTRGMGRRQVDHTTALGRLAQQRTRAVRDQEESNNNSGLFFSGRGKEAVGDVNTSFQRAEDDANLSFNRANEDDTLGFNRGNDDDKSSLDRLAAQRAWSNQDHDNSDQDIARGHTRQTEGFDRDLGNLHGRYGTGQNENYGIEGIKAQAALADRDIAIAQQEESAAQQQAQTNPAAAQQRMQQAAQERTAATRQKDAIKAEAAKQAAAKAAQPNRTAAQMRKDNPAMVERVKAQILAKKKGK